MKIFNIYRYLLLLSVFLLVGNLYAHESETQRELLIKYLHFYYIASPNKLNSAYKLDNAMIAKKNTCTKCGNFWTNPNTKYARDLLRALFSDTNQGGDLKLQRTAYHILKPYSSTDPKFVQIWIYDDLKEPLNQHALAVYQPCESEKGHVWPCAAGLKESGFEKYGGFMHLGTSRLQKIGAGKSKATFLHELSHAQDHIIAETDASYTTYAHASHLDEPNLWLNEARQKSKHTVIEATPSWPLAYREALANTFDLVYNPDEAKRIFQWYLDNTLLLVDAEYDEENPGISKEEWLYHRISKDLGNSGTPLSAKEYDPVIAQYYRGYLMKELPPALMIRNEMIMTLMFYGYINYVGLEEFRLSLLTTNDLILGDKKREIDDLFRRINNDDRKDPFRVFFHFLNINARPGNMTVADLPTSSGQGPKSHLLLIAYIDYFTRYRIQSKEEFAKVFGVTHGKVTGTFHDLFSIYVDLYWAQAKDKVRKTVTLFDAEFEDLELIARILDIPVPE